MLELTDVDLKSSFSSATVLPSHSTGTVCTIVPVASVVMEIENLDWVADVCLRTLWKQFIKSWNLKITEWKSKKNLRKLTFWKKDENRRRTNAIIVTFGKIKIRRLFFSFFMRLIQSMSIYKVVAITINCIAWRTERKNLLILCVNSKTFKVTV